MAATYRYLAYDLRTMAALGELPLAASQPSYSGVLNGIGELTFAVAPTSATAALLRSITRPERTVVFVERNGVLISDCYILWTRTMQPGKPWQLAGAGVGSFLRRNRIVTNLGPYTATDQFTIARAIVNDLQAQTGGDIGINVGSGTCGVTRDRTYYAYERKNTWDALAQLAAVDYGFDFAIESAWSDDASPVPELTLHLSYPRRGRIAGQTGIVFEWGKNMIDYKVEEDGTRSARVVDVLGAGDGVDMRISTASRTDLLDAGWPLTAEVLSAKDVTVQATLDDHAIAAVAARAATPTFLTIWVDGSDRDGGIGTWIVGDDVEVRISDDLYPAQSDGSPGLQGWYRIIGYKVTPSDGVEKVELTLGQVSA